MTSAAHALTVLTRLAGRRPAESTKLRNALAGRIRTLAPFAIDVAIETGDPIGRILAELLAESNDCALANDLRAKLPEDTMALRETAAIVLQMLVNEGERRDTSPTKLALLRLDLSARLSAIGKRPEALDHAHLAVKVLRTAGATFHSEFARALATYSSCLDDMGKHSEGLAAITESVELRRVLRASNGHEGLAALAKGLGLLAASLRALGDRRAALESAQEAVSLTRELAKLDSGRYRPLLADQLSKLATLKIEANDVDGSICAGREALDLFRTLAERTPDGFLHLLATELNNVSNELAVGRRFEEALMLVQEAADIMERLAGARPAAFAERYARILNSLSNRLNDCKRTGDAIDCSQRAVAILRPLADEEPEAFQQRLGMALHSLAYRLFEANRLEESLKIIDEAIAIRRRLLLTAPTASRIALAMSGTVRASTLRKAGRNHEACVEIVRAVEMLLVAARELGGAVSREALEIGGRALNWHAEAGVALPEGLLSELGRLTGVDKFGATS